VNQRMRVADNHNTPNGNKMYEPLQAARQRKSTPPPQQHTQHVCCLHTNLMQRKKGGGGSSLVKFKGTVPGKPESCESTVSFQFSFCLCESKKSKSKWFVSRLFGIVHSASIKYLRRRIKAIFDFWVTCLNK
jgi:hypothetical protein